MRKYNLKDIELLAVLPDDVNDEADRYAASFKSAGLMAMMRMYREKKITDGYGEATHLNKAGQPVVIFSFQRGICKHASPVVWVDSENVAKGSMKFY